MAQCPWPMMERETDKATGLGLGVRLEPEAPHLSLIPGNQDQSSLDSRA